MNPESGADGSGFLGSLVPRPVLAVPAPRIQHMHIKYMFIVQRYGLMPAAAGGFLHRECGL
jgi:hypothetical protein